MRARCCFMLAAMLMMIAAAPALADTPERSIAEEVASVAPSVTVTAYPVAYDAGQVTFECVEVKEVSAPMALSAPPLASPGVQVQTYPKASRSLLRSEDARTLLDRLLFQG